MRLFLLTVAFVTVTCLAAPAGRYLWLQHAPTFVALPVLWYLIRSNRISPLSSKCCLTFVALHAIGARWIYSYVPYDMALERLIGFTTHDMFGWERNHYDRLVHSMYGVCFAGVAWEVFRDRRRLTGRDIVIAGWLSVQWVLASSALYEVAEWLVAISLAPDWADSYLGQQGDLWDPIKDMALAGAGAVVMCALLSINALAAANDGRVRIADQASAEKMVEVP